MAIPPGQFAYLLTEEFVKIPNNAMGLISLKFGVKGPGVVNVSGFHVDPGYHGRLVFSVHNAGPAPARLHRGQKVFLLWLADLDRESEMVKPADEKPRSMISEDMISKVDRRIHSVQELSEKLRELENEVAFFKRVAGIAATIVLGSISLAAMIFGGLRLFTTGPG
jgi:dCTP deaminase